MSLRSSQFLYRKCIPDHLSRHLFHFFPFPLLSLLCFALKGFGKSCLRTLVGHPRTLELKGDLANRPYLYKWGKPRARTWKRCPQGTNAGQTELSLPSAGVLFADPPPLFCSPSDRTCSLESLYRRVGSKESTRPLSQLQIQVSKWQRHLLPCVFSIRCNGCQCFHQPWDLKKKRVEIHSFTLEGPEAKKQDIGRVMLPLKPLEENLSCLFQLLGVLWLMAKSSLYLHGCMTFFVSMSSPLFFW